VNRCASWVGLWVGLVACGEGPSTSTDGAASTVSASESESSDSDSSESLDTSTSTSTAETDETETGEPCTGEVCNSTLTLTFTHALPLLDGPYRFLITTPLFDLVCGVEVSLEGQKTCYGWAFTDLSWTAQTVTVLLTNPFYDTNLNPEALPVESVSVQVEHGQDVVWEGVVAIDGGEPSQPDPCNFVCWSAVGSATIE
jgi:hypothetical protein